MENTCRHIYIKGAKNGTRCPAPIAKAADNNGFCCTHKALQNKEVYQCEGYKKEYDLVEGGLYKMRMVKCEVMVHSETKRCRNHKLAIHRKVSKDIYNSDGTSSTSESVDESTKPEGEIQ